VTITFSDLPLRSETIEALNAHGFTSPFPIQEQVLPIALDNHDVIGQAKTGTGKTLGFGLPIIEHVVAPRDTEWASLAFQGAPQALVVVPTRELCIQVAADLEEIASNRGIRTLPLYGGRPFEAQIAALEAGVEIVVGTPGRLLDLYRQGKLTLKHVNRVILDEADIMLDLGFLPDVEKLFSFTPDREQTMLFSATMPGEIISLARRFMNQPMHIRTADSQDEGTVVDRIKQFVYRAHAMDKVEMLARILQAEDRGPTIVFCRTKRTAQKTSEELIERGYKATTIHGDLGQGAREKALNEFKSGKRDVLIATDVAARGIDIDGITHVINFQCPEDEKTYVHRIGRTARAGADGIAVTFVDWDEMPKWKSIDQALSLNLPEPAETYSSSENLYAELKIPADARGRMTVKKEKPATSADATKNVKREKPAVREPREKRERKRTRSYKE
jgi:superfamily II DNA/RNA helicase